MHRTVECEHLKEPLFSNEESQPVKFKVKALMQVYVIQLYKLYYTV